jgi:hypothetical protein
LNDVVFLPPGKFFILPGTHLGTVAGNTLALYFLWFFPYVLWLSLIGIKLPRKNRKDEDGALIFPTYDTVFHSTVRKGLCETIGSVVWKRPVSVSRQEMENDDYEIRDVAVYMFFHALGIYLSVFLLAYPCYKSREFHATVLALLTILVVMRGSQHYTYYVVSMYGRLIRKDFVMELSTRGGQDYGSVGIESEPLVGGRRIPVRLRKKKHVTCFLTD